MKVKNPNVRKKKERIFRNGQDSANRGFTLLEIMIVIVLMATIATVATPKFKDIFEVNLKSSTRKMAGSIKFCFNEAIIKQATVRLNFDLVTSSYYHTMLITDPDSIIGEFVEMPSPINERQQLPEGIFFQDILTPRSVQKMEDGETYIMFYSTGYAEKAVIHIRDSHGNVFTLLVKPLTGGVKIFEGYVDFAMLQQNQTPFGSTSSSTGPFGGSMGE